MNRTKLYGLATLLAAAGLGGLAAVPLVAVILLVVAAVLGIVAWGQRPTTPAVEAAAPSHGDDDATQGIRAALVEQLENCRSWQSRDPARGEPAWARLRDAEPRLAAIGTMVDRVDLPPDLAALLIWQIATIRELWPRVDGVRDALHRTVNGLPNPTRQAELRDLWCVMLGRLQVVASVDSIEHFAAGDGIDLLLPDSWGIIDWSHRRCRCHGPTRRTGESRRRSRRGSGPSASPCRARSWSGASAAGSAAAAAAPTPRSCTVRTTSGPARSTG